MRFFGYGPGRFFNDDVADGRGTPLCFPTVFEDDIPLGFVLFALNDPFVYLVHPLELLCIQKRQLRKCHTTHEKLTVLGSICPAEVS